MFISTRINNLIKQFQIVFWLKFYIVDVKKLTSAQFFKFLLAGKSSSQQVMFLPAHGRQRQKTINTRAGGPRPASLINTGIDDEAHLVTPLGGDRSSNKMRRRPSLEA
jgi:hypothetical protein